MAEAGSLYSIAAKLNGGGIGRIALHAALGLQRAGLLQTLACQDVEPALFSEQQVARHRFRLPRRLVHWLPDQAYFYLKNLDFDLWLRPRIERGPAIYHGWTAQAPRSLALAGRRGLATLLTRGSTHILTQSRLLAQAQAQVGLRSEPIMPRVVWQCLAEYALADLILVPSEQVKRSFLDNGHERDNVIVVPFGVDLQRHEAQVHPQLDRRPDGPCRLFFVGQVSLRKGIVPLLRAMQILKQRGIDALLNLAGSIDAQVRPLLKQIEFPAERVTFLDYVAHPEGYLRAADIFVFPTFEEGSALVTYEALAAGTPMITTENAGSLARHEREALLVPAGDAAALADAIEQLIKNPDQGRQLAEAGRQLVAPYTWELYGDRVALVHRLLAKGEKPAEIQFQVDNLIINQ